MRSITATKQTNVASLMVIGDKAEIAAASMNMKKLPRSVQ